MKEEEEERLAEEARLESEEEDLRLKAEDEAHLVEESKLKSEQEEQARLKAEEDSCLTKMESRKQRIMGMRD